MNPLKFIPVLAGIALALNLVFGIAWSQFEIDNIFIYAFLAAQVCLSAWVLASLKKIPDGNTDTSDILNQMLSGIPAIVVVTDKKLRIIATSSTFVKKLHLSETDLPGKSLPDVLRHEGSSAASEFVQFSNVRDGGQFEANYLINGENHLTLSWTRHVTPNGDYLFDAQDISGLRHLQSATSDLEAQFQGVVENAVDGIITIDRNGAIELFNSSAENIFGYTADEVIGKNVRMLMPEPFSTNHDTYLENYHRTGEIKIMGIGREVRGLRKNGETFPLDLGVGKSGQGDQVIYIGTIRDISEQKQAELDLQASRIEAENANHAKTQFLSSMSHDLRTPLNAIIGFAELMKTDEEDKLSEDHQSSVDHISSAGNHLLVLIDEVLDLTKIESGKMSLNIAPVDIGAAVDECLEIIQPQAEATGISIQWSSGDGAGLDGKQWVWADSDRLNQVLLNLFSNAVKYNKPQGSIHVYCEPRPQADSLRISVEDTGLGIESHRVHEVFIPFNRLGAEQSSITGTGIGLNITRKLVELMNGQIGVKSEPGVGSIFYFDLKNVSEADLEHHGAGQETAPVETPNEPLSHKPKADAPDREFNVVYVEDNRANMHLMKRVIARHPKWNLIGAETAEIGLEIVAELTPDLILMDINLPGIDGIEALGEIRKIRTLDEVPVYALSANAMNSEVKRGLTAGF
jgi:PAS domain S-box-containing protein